MGPQEKLKRLKEYSEKHFSNTRLHSPLHSKEIKEVGSEITEDGIKPATKTQKNGRAVWPDIIHAKTLKLTAGEDGVGLILIEQFSTQYTEAGK